MRTLFLDKHSSILALAKIYNFARQMVSKNILRDHNKGRTKMQFPKKSKFQIALNVCGSVSRSHNFIVNNFV